MKLKTKFQDVIFDTGEVVDAFCYGEADRIRVNAYANDNERGEYNYYYNSIKDFTDHWEDAPEEPKKHYEILGVGAVIEREDNEDEIFRNQNQREIANYFETEEEAKKAVEKLKAWKRLKANGFKFTEWSVGFDNALIIKANYTRGGIYDDMNLIFGGEK